jgi:hypothetical protein
MKLIKVIKIFIICCLFILIGISSVSAHTNMQSEIISWGEDIGWNIDEYNHTNGSTVTYDFRNGVLNIYQEATNSGASAWEVVDVVQTSSSPTGEIYAFPDEHTDVLASLQQYTADANGHFTEWLIWINSALYVDSGIMAHEFGHAIGLLDLYEIQNEGMLMYNLYPCSASAPTTMDNRGAEVITGQHSNHTFNRYIDTGNTATHYITCSICHGMKLINLELDDDPHNYSEYYDFGGELFHRNECFECDYQSYASHNYIWDTNGSYHWPVCSICSRISSNNNGAHQYTNDCDQSCNICGYIRFTSHTYTNSCDTTCNVCGATRSITHTYTNSCDTTCNICGYTRSITHGPFQDIYNHTDFFSASCQARHVYDHTCTVCSTITGPAYGSYYTFHYYYTYYYKYTEFDYPNNRKRHWYDKKCNTCSVVYDLVSGSWMPI